MMNAARIQHAMIIVPASRHVWKGTISAEWMEYKRVKSTESREWCLLCTVWTVAANYVS